MQGIKEFTIKKHGKDRHIVTYDDTIDGRKLRDNHQIFLHYLNHTFKSSINSYAYKLNTSTRNAFTSHNKSIIFIKLDIHNFFESLTIDKFDKYSSYFNLNEFLSNTFKSCFVDNHLVIGFVSSPKLSDIFMYDFDILIENYLKNNSTLRYSRYCDDILISSINYDFLNLRKFKEYIISELSKLNLEINEAKTREFDLNVDTSVSFLGLNMSLDTPINKITVSKNIILKPINFYKKYSYLFKKYQNCTLEETPIIGAQLTHYRTLILSYVSYIKEVSPEYSYKRFVKKFNNQFGDWDKEIVNIKRRRFPCLPSKE